MKEKEMVFSKEQILGSKSIPHSKDILNVVLESEKDYSLSEVDKKIKEFKEKRVK